MHYVGGQVAVTVNFVVEKKKKKETNLTNYV
jgi:hypothetical protein